VGDAAFAALLATIPPLAGGSESSAPLETTEATPESASSAVITEQQSTSRAASSKPFSSLPTPAPLDPAEVGRGLVTVAPSSRFDGSATDVEQDEEEKERERKRESEVARASRVPLKELLRLHAPEFKAWVASQPRAFAMQEAKSSYKAHVEQAETVGQQVTLLSVTRRVVACSGWRLHVSVCRWPHGNSFPTASRPA
jgi:hypothetical protein